MVVGGPNTRADYHIELGEELFYQLTGDMVLETVERGERKAVRIREGHVFVLPGRVPHSPQRLAGTVGLVVERDRVAGELDGLRYYTRDGRILYEEWFACTDLGTQLKPVIERFFASDAHASGEPARAYGPPPYELDTSSALMEPVALRDWVAAHAAPGAGGCGVLCGPGAVDPALRGLAFSAAVHTAPSPAWAPPTPDGQAAEKGGAPAEGGGGDGTRQQGVEVEGAEGAPAGSAGGGSGTAAGGSSDDSSGGGGGGPPLHHFCAPRASEVFLFALPLPPTAPLGDDEERALAPCAPSPPTRVTLRDEATGAVRRFDLPPGHVLLVPGGARFRARVDFAVGGPGVLVTTNAAFERGAPSGGPRA